MKKILITTDGSENATKALLKAKKYAAYEMLTVLTGRNYIKTLFLKYGKII